MRLGREAIVRSEEGNVTVHPFFPVTGEMVGLYVACLMSSSNEWPVASSGNR